MASLEIPPVANKGAMQMAEVVEYLKPPDAACDASQLGLFIDDRCLYYILNKPLGAQRSTYKACYPCCWKLVTRDKAG